jgi:hypothetical protein
VHVLFTEDRTHVPTPREEWEQAIVDVDRALGLRANPWFGHAIVPALDATILGD